MVIFRYFCAELDLQKEENPTHAPDNGLDVFRHYISGEWRVGRNFLNPLYEDSRPLQPYL